MQAVAQIHDPEATVWRGDVSLPTVDQGAWLLGTTLGHPDFVSVGVFVHSAVHVDDVVVLLLQVGRTTHFVLCILSNRARST